MYWMISSLVPGITRPARSVSTLTISMSTECQGMVWRTWNSAPSMSRMNQWTVGLPRARRRV